MAQEFNIGAMKAEAMRKAFDIDIEKGRTGVYEDNAENRRLNRVGQHYGHKKEEEASTGKQPGKSAQPTGQEKKTSAATMESAAQGASDEALKRALADKKAPEDVKAAAKKELDNRGGGEEKKVEQKTEEKIDRSGGMSVKSQVFKDFQKLNSHEIFKRGFDVWGADENYMKEDKNGDIEIVSYQKDGTIIHDKVNGKTGEEDMKEYKSEEEFMREFAPDAQKKIDEGSFKSAEADLKALSEESDEAEEMFEDLYDYFHWEDEDVENAERFKNIEKHFNHKPGKQFDWKEEEYNGAASAYRKRMEEKGYIVVDFGHGTDTYVYELFKKKPEKKNKEEK